MDQADRDVVPPVKAARLVVNIRQSLMPWVRPHVRDVIRYLVLWDDDLNN